MADEVSLYHDANIQVTNLRAILQGKTYAMANVTSVSTFTQFASRGPAILLAVIGGVVTLAGFGAGDAEGCVVVLGIVVMIVGIVIARSLRNVYWVRIGSASGETNALSSRDLTYITAVVKAMNEAIVRRG